MTKGCRALLASMMLSASASAAGATEILVTTTSQAINGSDGACSLREAIYAANLDASVAADSINADGTLHLVATECTAGSATETDTIVLPERALFSLSIIDPSPLNVLGPTATPPITTNMIIDARGSTLQWVGSGNARLFAVISTDFDLKNAYVRNFSVKGGNGRHGGGGGLGAGGAIFGRDSHLTIEQSTFDGNGAVGGNGSANHGGVAGGGGGGIGGNGGAAGTVCMAGGGGGGGARGDGGPGGSPGDNVGAFGGGGGGTWTAGTTIQGGLLGGGNGGTFGIGLGGGDGHDGGDGGGGGGGTSPKNLPGSMAGNGRWGGYGGGGGGGGGCFSYGDGGHGGFGGGGGSGATAESNISGLGPYGGDGGFGGGGGAGIGGYLFGGPGDGGSFAGNASAENGGGGAGLGGAIFIHGGSVKIYDSTFTRNWVLRGVEGGTGAQRGRDAGAAVFAVDGSVTVIHTTIVGNESTGDGGGIVVYASGYHTTTFEFFNSIIANNIAGGVYAPRQCFVDGDTGSVSMSGSKNIIRQNLNCPGGAFDVDPVCCRSR